MTIRLNRQQAGFTLIEVMVVVVIIGILAAIAMPSYSEYVKRGYRTEGQAFLNDVSAREERYFAQNNSYITATDSYASLGLSSKNSSNAKYTLSISKVDNDGGYTLTAENQFDDDKCGNLTLTATGVKGVTASGADASDCWR